MKDGQGEEQREEAPAWRAYVGRWVHALGTGMKAHWRAPLRVVGWLIQALWRLTRYAFLALVFVAPALAVLYFVLEGDWSNPTQVSATLWLALCFLVLGVNWLVLALAFRGPASIARSAVFGKTPWPRILAAVVVLGMFPTLPPKVIGGATHAVVELGLRIPLMLARRGSTDAAPAVQPSPSAASPTSDVQPQPTLKQIDAPQDELAFVYPLLARFLTAIDHAYSAFVSGLAKTVSLTALVGAFALWAVLAIAIETLVSEELSGRFVAWTRHAITEVARFLTRVPGAAHAFLGTHKALNAQNLGFVIVLSVGIFLSMAAITALPRLRQADRPNDAVSIAALEADLRKLQISREDAAVAPDEQLDVLAETEAKGPHAVPPPPTAAVQSTESGAPIETGSAAPKAAAGPAKSASLEVAASDALDRSTKQVPAQEGPSAETSWNPETELQLARKRVDAAESAATAAIVDVGRAEQLYFSLEFDDPGRLLRFETLNKAREVSRTFDKQLDQAREELSAIEKEAVFPGRVAEQRAQLSAWWAALSHRHAFLREHVLSAQEKSLLEAISYYGRANTERRGSREELQHYSLIYSWYRDRVAEGRDALDDCAGHVSSARVALTRWNTVAQGVLRKSVADSPFDRAIRLEQAFSDTVDPLVASCPVSRSATHIPDPPPLGDSLGPLRFVAGWLLNSASLPLALIVGLVGFGLLGSVISTFVKEQAATSLGSSVYANDLFVTDLVGVILRGLSAAIVVFLAVQGGLAVLSGTGSDPNPYVLLLACFVAAVFSERVWQSAYQYLKDRLPDTEPVAGPKAGGPGSVTQPPGPQPTVANDATAALTGAAGQK